MGKYFSLEGKVTVPNTEERYWNKLKFSQNPGLNGFTRLPSLKSIMYLMDKHKFVTME